MSSVYIWGYLENRNGVRLVNAPLGIWDAGKTARLDRVTTDGDGCWESSYALPEASYAFRASYWADTPESCPVYLGMYLPITVVCQGRNDIPVPNAPPVVYHHSRFFYNCLELNAAGVKPSDVLLEHGDMLIFQSDGITITLEGGADPTNPTTTVDCTNRSLMIRRPTSNTNPAPDIKGVERIPDPPVD